MNDTPKTLGTAEAHTIVDALQNWARLQKKLAVPMDKFQDLTGAMPDCPLLGPVYEVWAAYTKMVSLKVGDNGEWLDYFENECHMGDEPHEVSWTNPDGTRDAVMLGTLEQLAYVLTH